MPLTGCIRAPRCERRDTGWKEGITTTGKGQEKEQETQEEERLMEEKKKKKQEEKKKKEGAQKKAAEQKTKVPETTKTSSSQPQPAGTSTSTSTSTITSCSNGKRACANGQQPAASRYLPREVPPRFRQQEQKQLLKRGQPLPTGALTSASPAPSTGQAGASPPPLQVAGGPHHPSKTQTDLGHSGLGDHYDSAHWGQQPNFRGEANCSWDKVIIDRTDKEAWPSITGTDTVLASECTTDIDSVSNCGSENSSMATGSAQGNFTGHTKKTNGNNGINGALVQSTSNQSALGAGGANGNGNSARGWGVAPGSNAGLAHCSTSNGDGKMDNMIGDGRSMNCWGTSASNAGMNLNLNPNANPAAWPVLGHDGTVGGANPPSIGSPVGAIGQNLGNQNGNPAGSMSAWGGLLPQESTEPQTSTSQNVSFSVQPQNLNTDGPNNTTSPMSSSPNPINAMQANGLPNWGMAVGMGAIIPPHLQGLTGANGSSVSQINGGSSDGMATSVWGMSPGNPSTVNSNSGFSQGNGDTVNSVLSAKHNGSTSAVQKEGNGGVWDSVSSTGPGAMAWGRGGSNAGGMHPGAWGHAGHNAASCVNGEWGKHPNQHSSSDINSKGSTGWDSPSISSQHSANDQRNSWAKAAASGTTTSDGSNGGAGNQNEGNNGQGVTGESRRGENGNIDQGQIQLPRQDLDPRVLSNTGWGQTPVKQNIAWDFNEAARAERKNDSGTDAWGGATPQPSNSGGKSDGSIMNSTNTSSVSGWVNSPPATTVPANTGWGENNNKLSNGQVGWGESASSTAVNAAAAAKSVNTWSGSVNQEDKSPGWGEPHKPKTQNWGDGHKSNPGWTSGGGDWTESTNLSGPSGDGKKCGPGWDSDSRPGPDWNDANSRSASSGWGNSTNAKTNPGTGWGESLKPISQQNWANKPQDNNVSGWGGPSSVKQNGSGWVGGTGPVPIPVSVPAPVPVPVTVPIPAKHKEINCESTGWEEPSPPSMRRKMEIDDGTSAWGDPHNYNKKTVNLWDRNKPTGHNGTTVATTTTTTNANMVEPQSVHQSSAQRNRSPLLGPASKSMQEGWGSGGDDLIISSSQWEEEEGELWNNAASQEGNLSCSSWGNAPKKSLPKGMKTSCKPDEAWVMSRLIKQLTDMGFPRDPAEEALKSNNMNLDQAMSALLEKKVELDKRAMGMSDYNGMINKALACRAPPSSKESSMDRPTFLDKLTLSFSNQDGGLAEEPTSSPFLPSPSLKLPHSNSALPNQAMGGIATGLGMQNLNSSRQIPSGNLGMFGNSGAAQGRTMQPPQQPPAQPLNPSQPNLRAQVPQFLSPQVQAQLLQFAAKNIGLNPALLTSPINPQHMTMLNQLYQLQLAYQRLQIQQQMLQAQRNVSGPMRQQEQQVARTINNMQQQIQQHQRQLAQALLMKQQPPPAHPSMHPFAGKSASDFSHPQAHSLSDLQTKEQQSSQNNYTPYPLVTGMNTNMNVGNMDITAGLSVKDNSQSQSRLPQWTHPNSIDNLSNSTSPHDQNHGKHGAIPGGLTIGPPMKPSIEDSYGRYDLIQNSDSPASPTVAIPDSWSRAKSDAEKISNGSNISWPPEFHPGVPWKGLQNIDPENDPDVTPGSVPTGPTINTTIQDVNRYLLKSGGSSPTTSQNASLQPPSAWLPNASNYASSVSSIASAPSAAGKISDMKSTWSPGPISHTQASLSQELWKVPRNTTAPTRPPPGLSHAKPSSTWGANQLGWTSSYSSGSAWSTDSSGRTSSWLVLRNLTPQIDGSTLRTLCLQHGPLITFHLNLTQGNAVVRYSSKEEAAKAQKSLHMCVLGNTTILAEFAGEEEVNRFLAQGQPLPPTSNWQSNTGNSQARMGPSGGSHSMVRNDTGHWNTPCLGGKGNNDLLWGGVPQYSSSLWGPPTNDDGRVIRSPTPMNTLLPGDLLSGESM